MLFKVGRCLGKMIMKGKSPAIRFAKVVTITVLRVLHLLRLKGALKAFCDGFAEGVR
jgi:hypothetical protein